MGRTEEGSHAFEGTPPHINPGGAPKQSESRVAGVGLLPRAGWRDDLEPLFTRVGYVPTRPLKISEVHYYIRIRF